MRRITVLLITVLLLTACSVQERMSPEIFVERLAANDKKFSVETFFAAADDFLCFGKYDDASVVIKISSDKEKNAKKITLSCIQTNKTESFISCAENLISIYSPNDNSSEVINNLFESKDLNDKCVYYDTQWYKYSKIFSKQGLYFSVESKKLSPQNDVELSLKQNDITEY